MITRKQLTYTLQVPGNRLQQQILPTARSYSSPVHIPAPRRLTPEQMRRHKALRIARAPKTPQGPWLPAPTVPPSLCKVGALSWLIGAALALLLSLDGWL